MAIKPPPGFSLVDSPSNGIKPPPGFTIEGQQEMGGSPPLGVVAKKMWEIMPQNPKNLVQNLPLATGAVGGASPVPGGAMMGTGAGQAIRDAILKVQGKPLPSGLQHGLELGGAALGDIVAIPGLKKASIGKQIGAVEAKAGVPPVQEITSLPKPKAGEPVSGGIDQAIQSVSDAKSSGGAIPTYWKQIKDQIDSFYDLGKDVKLTTLDKGKLKWLSAQVQEGLNQSVPGRGPLAADLARSQTIPNFISRGYKAIPKPIKTLTGLTGAGTLADALARRISR